MMYQYNDISVQKLRDSKIVQGEMLQQFENIRLEQSVIKTSLLLVLILLLQYLR